MKSKIATIMVCFLGLLLVGSEANVSEGTSQGTSSPSAAPVESSSPAASSSTSSSESNQARSGWSLEQCIAYALEHSPSLAKQKLTADSAKYEIVIAEAAFDVRLSADGRLTFGETDSSNHSVTLNKSFEHGFDVRASLDGSHRNNQDQYDTSLSIEVSKKILGGGSTLETRYDLEASMLDELSAMNTYARQRRKLVLDVTLAYYNIIRAEQSLKVKERALENSRQTLLITREREKPLDILTAELRVPDNELSVNTAKRTIRNGHETLKILMGMPTEETLSINGVFEYKVGKVDATADMAFAQENLETLLNNRLEQKKLQMLMDIREENRLPDVSLTAAHRQYGDGDGYNFSGHDEQTLGVNLNWTVGRRADIARHVIAQNNYAKNRHDYFTLNQELSRDMGNTLRQLREYEEAVKLQELKCDLLRRKEELYRDRWENGEIDILELVRTQTDLEDSQVDLIGRKVSYMELLANYHYLIGR